MTRKVYRTAQGKLVDLGRLQLQNENTRAVGNMGVNARGDKIDSQNKTVEKKTNQVQRQYNRQTAQATQAVETRAPERRKSRPSANVLPPKPPEDFEDDFEKSEETKPASGLAAAIAKAREIKQDPLRSMADTAKHQEGVRKI